MNIEVKITENVEVTKLQVSAKVRYWEDAEVNGFTDTAGDKMPCRKGELWEPLIDLVTGKIENWEIGKTASVTYKVCDAGTYTLLGEENKEVVKIDGYVPKILCPKDNGYGDYIIMDIDANGIIQHFDGSNLQDFEDFKD